MITRMKKADQVSKFVAETDTLVELIFEYRGVVKSFEWQAVREVVLDRLEGSRRSSSGHRLEAARGYGSGNRETPRRKVVASQK